MIHLKAGQHVYTVGHDVFDTAEGHRAWVHGVTVEDAVGNWATATAETHSISPCNSGTVEAKRTEQDVVPR